jgi:hypothetical protein
MSPEQRIHRQRAALKGHVHGFHLGQLLEQIGVGDMP